MRRMEHHNQERSRASREHRIHRRCGTHGTGSLEEIEEETGTPGIFEILTGRNSPQTHVRAPTPSPGGSDSEGGQTQRLHRKKQKLPHNRKPDRKRPAKASIHTHAGNPS